MEHHISNKITRLTKLYAMNTDIGQLRKNVQERVFTQETETISSQDTA